MLGGPYSPGMTTDTASSPPRAGARVSWTTLAAVGAAFSAAGSLALHAVGAIQHGSFIAAFGLDPELFPRSTQATVLAGYYALFDRTVAGLSAIRAHPLMVLGTAAALAAYITLALLPVETKVQAFFRRLHMVPHHWRKPLGHFGLGLVLLVLAPLVSLFAAALFLAVPGLVGEGAGLARAQHLQADFALGCQASKQRCVTLTRDGTDVARGYVIDVSDEDMALFDVERRAVRLLPRKGLSWEVPAANQRP